MSYAVDRPEILLMEKELQSDIISRAKQYFGKAGEQTNSIYFHAVLEEYSRPYETVSVGATGSITTPTCEYHNFNGARLRFPDVDESSIFEEQSSQIPFPEQTRIVHDYHPISTPQTSVFRKVPTGNKSLVDNCSLGYTKLLVSIGPKEKILFKNRIPEPIFGSISLYCLNKRGDGDLVKIAETFNFDATPPELRQPFQHVYRANTAAEPFVDSPLHFNPIGNISKCLFSFPSELSSANDIFLVIELSKVLTGDPDKSLLPYVYPDKKNLFGGGSTTELTSLQETCTRLRKFRQPLGISVVKVFLPDGQVYQNQPSPGGCITSVFALKHCLSETGLKQHIQDIFPPEGASPQIRLEITGIDVCLSMHNLGNDYVENIRPPQGLYGKSEDLVGENDFLYFLPSQFHNEDEAEDISWCKDIRSRFAVRSMLFHPPLTLRLPDDAWRAMRSTLDHTLFVSPISFENFHRRNERNLCMEIKLIEFLDPEDGNDSPFDPYSREYIVLNHIYNPLPGYTFCLSQCTRVSYHKTNPELDDEVKIRLPIQLTRNHYLLFQIYHVHVKAGKVEPRSSIGGFFSNKKGNEDNGEIFSIIGHCFVPLLLNDSTLLSDGEYAIPVVEENNISSISDDSDINPSPTPPSHLSGTPGALQNHSGSFRLPSVNLSDRSLYLPSYTPYSQVYNNNTQLSRSTSSAKRNPSTNLKSTFPTITIRTKLFSSYYSTNKDLQNYFNHCPEPLGVLHSTLPSSSRKSSKRATSSALPTEQSVPVKKSLEPISEPILKDATKFFLQTTGNKRLSMELSAVDSIPRTAVGSDDNLKIEICRHFPSLMRQIIRVLGGGVSTFHLKFMNPYSHTDLRCCTFLALLRIFDIIAPNLKENSTEDEMFDSEFLRSYIEYVFDEEIHVPPKNNESPSDISATISNPPSNPTENEDELSKKSDNNLSPNPAIKALTNTKKSKQMDLVRRQLTSIVCEEDLFEKTVDHILEQVLKISFQGVLLSSINKIAAEISLGKLTQSTQLSDLENPGSHQRWWKGHINDQSILEAILNKNPLEDLFGLDEKLTPPHRLSALHPLKDPIILDPLLPRYQSLDGYVARKLRATSADAADETESKPVNPPSQWWPWMYEIITYQWRCLLNIYDEATPPPTIQAVGTNSGATTSSTMSTTNSIASKQLPTTTRIDEGNEEEEEEEGGDIIENDDESVIHASPSHLSTNTSHTDETHRYSGWYGGEPYPFNANDTVLKDVFKSYSSGSPENVRSLLIKYGPILLNMIYKSLALRILRENKSPPVIIDEEYLLEAELLFTALGKEVHLLKKSVIPSRRLNMAISIFFRDLFGLLVPIQVTRLVYAFMLASRKIQKENSKFTKKVQVLQIKTRINFLHELSRIDHFFAINFPLFFGVPYSQCQYIPIYNTRDILEYATGTEIRNTRNPPSHWLIHLIIHEIMVDYVHIKKELKEGILKMIRELCIRLVYDSRHQTVEYRNRIAAMFLPLLPPFIELATHYSELPSDSIERRDALILVAYILQESSEYLIREEIRRMTKSLSSYHSTNINLVTTLNNYKSSHASVSHPLSPLPIHSYKLPIFHMITLLHLMIETFELPLSDAGEKGDVSVSLSPGIIIDSTEGQEIGSKTMNSISKIQVKSTEDALGQLEALTSKRAMKGQASSASNQQLQSTSTTTSSRPTRNDRRATSTAGDSERNWKKSLKNQTLPSTNKGSGNLVSLLRALTSVKYLSYETTLTVIKTIQLMIEECPKSLNTTEGDGEKPNPLYSIYCDTHYSNNFKEFMSYILSLLLHILYSTQSEHCIESTFYLVIKIVLNYGLPTIIKFMGDTLQHWLRKIFLCFNSNYFCIRSGAVKCFEVFLQSCYQWEGSLQTIILPSYSVINDTLKTLSTRVSPSNSRVSKPDYTRGLRWSFESLRTSTTHIFLPTSTTLFDLYQTSKSLFLKNFVNIIDVLIFIINQLDRLIPYDWNGGLGYSNFYEVSMNNGGGRFKAISDDKKNVIINSMKSMNLENVFEQFLSAANSFGTHQLPRFKIYIYENLYVLYELYNHIAEMGMIRWKIYEICEQMEKLGTELWSPKPPLKVVRRGSDTNSLDKQSSFMNALIASLSLPIAHPWPSSESLRKHSILSLQISIDLFREAHLTYLAERSLNALIGIYRHDHGENLKQLGQCYEKLSKLFEEASSANMNFAMGTFFRVLFIGQGVPNSLRGKEYIVRNGSYLHVSEFQTLIKQQLQTLVGDTVPVNVLPDTSPMPSDDSLEAYAYMTSLTPVISDLFDVQDVPSSMSSTWKKRLNNIAYRNEYSVFQFSVPYTKEGKAHAKTMDLQWKRTTLLYVQNPFPDITTRQIVLKREVKDLSPIEVALDDIQERVATMTDELRKPNSKVQSDINNLMRLVQGTVAPQVNAGAAEVAKVFLQKVNQNRIESFLPSADPDQQINLRNKLKDALVQFLDKSRSLLEKYRLTTGVSASEIPIDTRTRSPTLPHSHSSSSTTGLLVGVTPTLPTQSLLNIANLCSNKPSHHNYFIKKYYTRENEAALASALVDQQPIPSESNNGKNAPSSGSVTVINPSGLQPSSSGLFAPSELVWLTEMEKGYDILVDAIYPYICDIATVMESRNI